MADVEENSLQRIVSHGRGGAGNIGKDDLNAPLNDINSIPTIKSPVYTTGRGGTGNMAVNDPNHPELARAAQDIEISPPKQSVDLHGGRGGAGNVLKAKDEEEALRKEEEEREKILKKTPVDHSKIDYRGWADKGKDLLFGKKK